MLAMCRNASSHAAVLLALVGGSAAPVSHEHFRASFTVTRWGLQGRICTFYASGYYQVCQRHAEVPRLTALQNAAFAELDRLAGSEEFFMEYELQPGDIQVTGLAMR